MQAELIVERIERRLSPDEVSDADWLQTETETTSDGQLRILESCRLSNGDVGKYGAERVQRWIEEDKRRYEGLGRDWWFVDALAVAVIGVHVGEAQIGTFEVASGCIGGIESDAPVEYYRELTDELIAELKDELAKRDLMVPEEIETPFVCSECGLLQVL